MTIVRLSLVFTLTTLAVTALAQSTVDWSRVAEKTLPAVVTVLAENSEEKVSGTGFFIHTKGWVVTNYHVIKGMRSIRVRAHNGRIYNVKSVLFADSNWDLALLDTGATPPAVLETTLSINLKPGEPVCVIGSPMSLEGTVSTGVVSALREFEGRRVVQITAPISPGSSGSPVLNAAGKVIGVATQYIQNGQNLNMAVSSEHLMMAMILTAIPQSAPSQSQRKRVTVTPRDNLSAILGKSSFSDLLEIELSEGTYYLDEPLWVVQPLILRGAGPDKTRIVSSSKQWVIGFMANTKVMVSDVSFEYIGNEDKSAAVIVLQGQANFYRCRFKGGIGAWFRNTASVTLDSCIVEKNSGIGILVGERAQVSIKDTVIQQNGVNGIYILQDGSATLLNTTCQENAQDGIATDDYAQVTLKNSHFVGNRSDGIALWGNSIAVIENSTCKNNAKNGIYADKAAKLVAKNNLCEGNSWAGIALFGQVEAALADNTCKNNAQHGICAHNAAKLVAKNNLCEGNSWTGIVIFDQVEAALADNTCRSNQTGVYIESTARVGLQNNNVYNNQSNVVDKRR
ncbi:MAG: hypothetical protein KatS3mg023_0934 [Armatimonadota bacterium]|nr:MAG: hypothetical protein KatS3mg023_0934 [Armatimonadota bacterium]